MTTHIDRTDHGPPESGAAVVRAERDRGAILMLALVLCVVMSIIAVGLLKFTSTGLRTSSVSTDRTERSAAATAGVFFVLEELSTSEPLACASSTDVPIAATPEGRAVTVTCSQLTTGESPAEFELVASTDGGAAGIVTALVEVRSEMSAPRSTRIISWTSNG